jgi:hypothetical protein
LVLDGSRWQIEGFRDGIKKTVEAHAPRVGSFYDLGLLLIEMAALPIERPRIGPPPTSDDFKRSFALLLNPSSGADDV